MYKLLLCWRYLRTRYIALASIISVTLGVATMIVVNAVMAGFSHEMEARMHGILSDIVLEGHGLENIESPQLVMDNIQLVAGKWITGMTPTVHVPAIITFNANGQPHSQQIMFIGIDDATYASVSDFSKYLQHPDNRKQLSFELHDDGYDTRDHQLGDKAPLRVGMDQAVGNGVGSWPSVSRPIHKYNRKVQTRNHPTVRIRMQRLTTCVRRFGQKRTANKSPEPHRKRQIAVPQIHLVRSRWSNSIPVRSSILASC